MFLRRKLSDKRFYAFHFIFPSIHISSLTGVAAVKIPVHACMHGNFATHHLYRYNIFN
jgi:hypothetical protein